MGKLSLGRAAWTRVKGEKKHAAEKVDARRLWHGKERRSGEGESRKAKGRHGLSEEIATNCRNIGFIVEL